MKLLFPYFLFLAFVFVGHAESEQLTVSEKWKGHADYLVSCLDRIQKAWDKIMDKADAQIKKDAQVALTFTLRADGTVTIPPPTKRQKDLGRAYDYVVQAVKAVGQQPAWTEKMKADLGTEQSITMIFKYFESKKEPNLK